MLTNVNTKQIVNGPITNKNVQITDFLFVDREQVCVIKTAPDPITGDKVDAPLTYGTDYEITKYIPDGVALTEMALTASTGTCLLKDTVDVAEGESITMYRKSALIQNKEYPRTGPFPSATHEGALDFLTMQNQEQTEQINRCAKVPITVANFSGDLPYPNPGKALIINATGTGITLAQDNYIDQAVNSAANALVATQQASIASSQASAASLSALNAALAEAHSAELLTQVSLAQIDALNAILAQETTSNNNLIATGDAKILLATQQAINSTNSAIRAETAASTLEGIIPNSGDEGKFLMCDPTSYTNGVSYQEVLGGVVKFNSLGTISSNQTLNKNEITTAAFTGTPTISLPIVTDTAKQVGCILDFTTTASAYPIINKGKNLAGTVTVTNASATVTGVGTLFTTETQVGDKLIIATVEYTIATITSNTSLTLSSTYTGTTISALTIARKILRWSKFNNGAPPTTYPTTTGIRNKIEFKSIWENGLLYWETKHDTYGGVEVPWVQPTLANNGTFGISELAVWSSAEGSDPYQLFKAFDGNAGTYTDNQAITITLDFFTLKPTKWSQLYFTIGYDQARLPGPWQFYESDDRNIWRSLGSGTNTNSSYALLALPNSSANFCQFHRLVTTCKNPGTLTSFAECLITATRLLS